ncbi:MAG: phenylacetate--CoA ligase [Chloroflexi bacterium]|nr:phenylacetate--CoA ligase [Chloroflexota bacterium]
MSRDVLGALQLQRLQWQVARCYAEAPFYRERLDAAGVRPEDIKSLDDVRRIPVVTKQQLRDEQVAHPPFGRYTVAPASAWREVHPSTGTTGIPVNTIWSERDVEHIAEFTARTMWSFGVRPGDVVQNAFSYGLWVAGMAVHYAARRLGTLCIPIGAAETPRQIWFMEQAGSTVLLATPSYALHIAEQMRLKGVDPQRLALRRGCFGGEAGTEAPATRRKIEQGLGIDAYDYYGLAEIHPTFASECEAKAGIHWAEDHHLIEVVNPDTQQPCAEGEVGVLVITHLTREATPMLRYWTNDYARLTTARCACGRTHARSEGGILGRHDDLVIYRGAKFYPVQVEKVVRGFAELSDEFRVELGRAVGGGAADTCTVVVEATSAAIDEAALRERLRQALRAELQVTPEVRFVPFGTLERTTFKAKRIVRADGG